MHHIPFIAPYYTASAPVWKARHIGYTKISMNTKERRGKLLSVFVTITALLAAISCAGTPDKRKANIEELEITAIVSNLTLRQSIGQRFIGWVPREGFSGEAKKLVTAGEIGGFIVYKWNYDSIEDIRLLTDRMQSAALANQPHIPLFIAADQEGGRVAAFRFDEFVRLPAPFHLAQNLPIEAVEEASFINAIQLNSIGINMNLAPVLDLYPYPDDSIIGDRSFGPDIEISTSAGLAFVRGSIRGGVLPVVKHFPGHGLSTVDSHGNLPVIDSIGQTGSLGAALENETFSYHLAPFRTAIESGVPAIMPAHLLIRAVDPVYPVTLSTVFIRELLRDTLGFTGLIVSDGLAMGALSKHFPIEESLARCFLVGIDVILVHSRYSLSELIDITVGLVEKGTITRKEIDEGTSRVLTAKRRAGIFED